MRLFVTTIEMYREQTQVSLICKCESERTEAIRRENSIIQNSRTSIDVISRETPNFVDSSNVWENSE